MLYFIVNQGAGAGKAALRWRKVRRILKRRKIKFRAFATKQKGHARLLAQEICRQQEEDICMVVLGGDGTINEAINGITDFENVRFGIIPAGSGNDFARGLGIRGTTEENLDRILNCAQKGPAEYQPIDLGQVSSEKGTRLFAISAGIGLDAVVCRKALHSRLKKILNRFQLGKLTYLFLTVQALLCMDTAGISSFFAGKGTKRLKEVIFLAAMNFCAEGGGVPMAPRADAQDGKLSVCAAFGISKWRTFFCLPLLLAARHEHIRGFGVADCGMCRIRADRPMALHTDGEYCGEVAEVMFSCLPGRLRVMKQIRE